MTWVRGRAGSATSSWTGAGTSRPTSPVVWRLAWSLDRNTFEVDVTNFSPKTDFRGSRENLHLVERWTRTGPTTLAYVVTIEDPTVWTRPWIVTQEFAKQSDQQNRVYYEPRCIEGNYGLPGLLRGVRMEEFALAEGRGPDPANRDNLGPLAPNAEIVGGLQDPYRIIDIEAQRLFFRRLFCEAFLMQLRREPWNNPQASCLL